MTRSIRTHLVAFLTAVSVLPATWRCACVAGQVEKQSSCCRHRLPSKSSESRACRHCDAPQTIAPIKSLKTMSFALAFVAPTETRTFWPPIIFRSAGFIPRHPPPLSLLELHCASNS